jgi:guanine deaminase
MLIQDLSGKENIKALRGSLLHFLSDPGIAVQASSYEYIEDGLLILADGLVLSIGEYSNLIEDLPAKTKIEDHSGCLIMPGFIDSHVHYVQTDIIASYGEQLLHWLEKFAFPAERRFEDNNHSKEVAEFFLNEMLRNGTTSALVMGSVHKQSAEAIFSAAHAKKMRLMAGKVLMDRNCPEYLQDTPESGYRDSKSLIDKWHGNDRLLYAVTPRFAPTSSPEQLAMAGRLLEEYPDVFMHTHVAENREEVAWVSDLFTESRSYLDVYDKYGLLRERAVLAHCIHLDHDDHVRMAATGASAAFCPTSNLFLGSGFFDLNVADEAGFRVGIATDVAGGTSFNMLQILNEAYKVLQVKGQSLNPLRAFYLATLGSARALYIDNYVGNFSKGKEADFIVVDFAATPLLERRTNAAKNIEEKLFALMMLGDDRAIRASYLMGELAHSK